MKKDARYYEKRLDDKAEKYYLEKISCLKGDEFLSMMDYYDDHISSIAFLSRINIYFQEAEALISALIHEKPNLNKKYELTWVDRIPRLGESRVQFASHTYDTILERLEWISNENFGNDIEEWQSWLKAFKDAPPVVGR